MNVAVHVLDVGPVTFGDGTPGLGWAGRRDGTTVVDGDNASLEDLADIVVHDLRAGTRVALGFEAPGWVPVPTGERRLLRARAEADTAPGGARSAWSGRVAVWGTARLLALAPWVLGRIGRAVDADGTPIATLDLETWRHEGAPLLLFEAYVAGHAKPTVTDDGNPHAGDALAAVDAFERALRDETIGDEVTVHPVDEADGSPFSILGSAMLHAGLTADLAVLRTAPLLVRPAPAPSHLHDG